MLCQMKQWMKIKIRGENSRSSQCEFFEAERKEKIGCSCFLLKIALTMYFIQFFVGWRLITFFTKNKQIKIFYKMMMKSHLFDVQIKSNTFLSYIITILNVQS